MTATSRHRRAPALRGGLHYACCAALLLGCAALAAGAPVAGDASVPAPPPVEQVFTNALTPWVIAEYRVQGDPALTQLVPAARLEPYTGTQVTLLDIVRAASALQREFHASGYTNVTLTLGRDQITNGIVTLYAFRSGRAQIVVDGKSCAPDLTNPTPRTGPVASGGTPAPNRPKAPPPGFPVRAYEIRGDTLLSTKTLSGILEKYTGTNITVANILQAGSDLQTEYRRRGFATVNVTIPPQKLDSNAIVKIRVFEGRLAEINVLNNRYFSSNNVMRALPSLHTNQILLEPVFQAELDRANANQDRQIYPQIGPGPVEGTTTLDLKVKDRLPLHAKVELDNQSSPGTPQLRLNTSAVYDNLWQYEHAFGVQYGFSPEAYKQGSQWAFYDRPLVANYSGFYRLPLGTPEAVEDMVTSKPGSFGFDEQSRQFRLPPVSARPELNFYASRSTIDTGLQTLQDQLIYDIPGVRQVTRQDVEQDIIINQDAGFRLSTPLPGTDKWRSTFSGGVDYKTYALASDKTNNFGFTETTISSNNQTNVNHQTVASAVPSFQKPVDYVPLSLRYDGSLRDRLGTTFFGLGFTVNTLFSGALTNLQNITGSSRSSGNWVVLNPNISREFSIYKDWVLALRADGQWASEPLISTERFGVGGVNSVRGYREGEVFGDNGWHVTAEQRTPGYVLGLAYPGNPMTLRGAIYMDYGEAYVLDPNALTQRISLWGTGLGAVVSVGSHWEARFLCSWPLLDAGGTTAFQPLFNFSLSGQF